jgi:NAD(P)-dependent dehydrogenase (short-subunit alcohol dehydrogenase family)
MPERSRTTASFGALTTTDELLEGVDLSGMRVLVTGVSSGLGLETARAAAAHGAEVVGTARDRDKADVAIEPYSDLAIEVVECDLASLASVQRCADSLTSLGAPFDVVVANAGVMNCPYGRTVDGFETHFGTNHLGHFLLVNRIAGLIREGGRVVVLTSMAHHTSDVDLDDPGFERTVYVPFQAYGRSKTANVLFAIELDRRLRRRAVRGIAVQPGGVRTPLLRHTTPEVMQEMMRQVAAHSQRRADGSHDDPVPVKTVEQGAATTIWAAFVAPAEAVGGRYCEDCHVAEVTESGTAGVRPYAVDLERAAALWAASEDLVGERFPLADRSPQR